MKKVVIFLLLILSLVGLGSCNGTGTPPATPTPNPTPNPTPTPTEVITLTFRAASFSDWSLDKVEGSSTVGTVGNGNPEITLEVGKRYRIINLSGSVHPFALTSSTFWGVDYLLSQKTGQTGRYAFDKDVNFVQSPTNDGFTFTLTAKLAAELKSYICTAHTGMVGQIKVTGL
jgi:plastocyanin